MHRRQAAAARLAELERRAAPAPVFLPRSFARDLARSYGDPDDPPTDDELIAWSDIEAMLDDAYGTAT